MIVFVGGIHGVGKTYLGGPAAQHIGILHATASQLIREERGLQTWGSDKRVDGIDENQAALVSATTRLRAEGQKLLLDGHFVLRGADGALNEVDIQVFRELKIAGVLLLAANLQVISDRLRERGDHSWSELELRKLAEHEENHARRVSRELGLPFKYMVNPTHEEFVASLMDILGS